MSTNGKPSILEGSRVYVVEPFPAKDIHRVYSWMKAFKTIVMTDQSPKNKTEFINHWTQAQANGARTFGIIDKNNFIDKEPFALVGALMFEPNGKFNGYLHAASRTSVFGSRMVDEAALLVIKNLFETQPLTRLSAMVHSKNNMAASLAKRVGFVKEGKFEDMILQRGEPKAVLHFGLTRRDWSLKENDLWASLHRSSPRLEDSLDLPLEKADDKVDNNSNSKQPELVSLLPRVEELIPAETF